MKTEPMGHQVKGLEKSEGKRNFAFLCEQGTGKTWLTLADGERCYIGNKIEAMLILAPKGVHTNWVRREIPTHLEVPFRALVWKGNPTTKKAKAEIEKFYEPWRLETRRPLMVFTINIDAINHAAGYAACERFLTQFKTMMVIDESTRIKNVKAQRTKKAIKLGEMAIARRILSGTPMPKAPSDLFSQFSFLKKGLVGTSSYSAFMNEFAVLLDAQDPEMQAIMRNLAGKVHGIPQVVKKDVFGRPMFRNLEKLSRLIDPHSFRVKKEDCLDLPSKIYKPVYFELSVKQRDVYAKLELDYEYSHEDSDMGVQEDMSFASIAARTKMKQVTSGFINIYGDPVLLPPEDNPRMNAFQEVLDSMEDTMDSEQQFIVWAMYDEEIKHVCEELEKRGILWRKYTGSTTQADREAAIDDFQSGKFQCFVGNPAAAGIGLTLTAATMAIYYSCSYDNELRLQSEDRCHRIGTKKAVTYIDLIAEETLDEDIMRSLSNKTKMAGIVLDKAT